MKGFVSSILSILLACSGLQARNVLNVSTTGCDATADGSVAKPYYSLQAAIDKASSISGTDTMYIEVASGEYRPRP